MTFVRRFVDETPTVLAVGFDGGDPIIDCLTIELDQYGVTAVPDSETALSTVGPGVVCVLSRFRLPDGSGDDVATSIRDADSRTPVLVVEDEYDEESAAAVATAGGTYVPLATGNDPLASVVRSAASHGTAYASDGLRAHSFDQLLSSYDQIVYVKDRDGRYVAVSDYSSWPDPETLLGNSDAELARTRDNEWDVMKKRHDDAMQVVESDEPIVAEIEQYGTGESAFWYERTIRPWRAEDGAIRGVIGLTREVSEWERRKRRMQDRIDQLERFTSFVSHDLRSPLQVASGYLDLARTGDEAAVDRIDEANVRMQELIDDLETLVSSDQGAVATTRSTRIVDLARDVWNVVATDTATLRVEMPSETTVTAAESEVRPLLENLFKNAIDHGGSDVTVWFGPLDDGFYVEDDGPGIPVAERSEVFSEGYTTSESGTGTGLAIVADAVAMHKWDVEIETGRVGGAKLSLTNCMMATDPVRNSEPGDRYEITANRDVGDVRTAGDATYDDVEGVWNVTGAGDDIYNESNDFHFAYCEVDGPVRIQARLVDIEEVNNYSKAGLIIRDSPDDDATHGYVGRTPGHGAETTWRDVPDGTTTSQQLESSGSEYDWLGLDRTGDTVTCSLSRDGEEWDVIDQRTVPLSDPVSVGLAVCSVVPRALCTATFDGVEVRELDPDTR